jgi:hypothetical protein
LSTGDTEQRKLHEFKKVWNESSQWIGNVIKDATNFALLNPSHANAQQMCDGSSTLLSRSSAPFIAEMEAKFNSTVWPSLKSRGWKSDVFVSKECNARKDTRYFFRGNEVRNIAVDTTVLAALWCADFSQRNFSIVPLILSWRQEKHFIRRYQIFLNR